MFNKGLVLAAIIAIPSIGSYAATINSTWVGGEDGAWENAANWSPAMVPDNNGANTFNVTIAAEIIEGNDISIGLTQSHTINCMDCNITGDDVVLDFGKWTLENVEITLTDANGITNYGGLDFGQINIAGNINNVSGAYLCIEDSYISGNIHNQANAILDFEGLIEVEGEKIQDGNNIENAGTICFWGPVADLYSEGTFSNTGQINLYAADCAASKIMNSSSGVIQGSGSIGIESDGGLFQNDGLISASGGALIIFSVNSDFVNNGTLRSEPSCALHIKPEFLGATPSDVNNAGTIEIKPGGGVTFYYNLINQPTGQIKLLAGTLAATTITQSAGATLEGFGNIAGNVIIEDNGIVKLTGPTNIVGDMTVLSGSKLKIGDGQTLITGQTENEGTIELIGGTVIYQGGYDGV